MSEDAKREDFLAQEYLTVQRFSEDFDARTLTIKAWSVTFAGVTLALAYTQAQPMLLLVASGAALVFWILEALWKVNQQAYYPRLNQIEKHFRGEAETTPFRITEVWDRAFKSQGKCRYALKIVGWPHVLLPHLIVLAAGIGLWLFFPPSQAKNASNPSHSELKAKPTSGRSLM